MSSIARKAKRARLRAGPASTPHEQEQLDKSRSQSRWDRRLARAHGGRL